MTASRSRTFALATIALAALSWWLVRGPISNRVAGTRDGSCGLPADCLADTELWGLALLGIALAGLAWLVVLVGLLGISAIAIGALVHRRWPDHPLARVTTQVLTYSPVVLLGAVTLWLVTIAVG